MAFNPTAATKLPANMGQTEAEIQRAVEAEVAAEIDAQISPLEDTIRQQQEGSTYAVGKLNELYGTIQPFAQNAATNLRSNFDTSIGFEKGVFDATQAQLAGVRQQAGAQAQALSQQLGVPIPVSLFDMGATTEQGLGLAEGAGALLTAQGFRDASLAEAEAFSGRVFPLMRKEQETETRNYFTNQITSLQKEIASLKKMKPGLVNERTRQRLLEERQYQLDRVTSQRDWELSKFSAGLESAKLKEAKAARKAADAATKRAQDIQVQLAKLGSKDTRRGQDLTAKLEKARLDAEKATRKAANTEYEWKRQQAIQENISKAIQAYTTGGSAKLKTVTKGIDARGNPVTEETTRDVPSGEGTITNPNLLLNAVLAAVPGAKEMPGFLRQQIIFKLRSLGVQMPSNWVEGQAAGSPTQKNPKGNAQGGILTLPTRRVMNTMSLASLEKVAVQQLGFKGGYPAKIRTGSSNERLRKAWLINWVARREVEENEGIIPGTTYGPH